MSFMQELFQGRLTAEQLLEQWQIDSKTEAEINDNLQNPDGLIDECQSELISSRTVTQLERLAIEQALREQGAIVPLIKQEEL